MQERRKGPDTRSAEMIAAVENYRRVFNEFIGSRGTSPEQIAKSGLSASLIYERTSGRKNAPYFDIGPDLRLLFGGEKREGDFFVYKLIAQPNRLIIEGYRDSDADHEVEFAENVFLMIHIGKGEILLPGHRKGEKISIDALEDLSKIVKGVARLPASSLLIGSTPLDLEQEFS